MEELRALATNVDIGWTLVGAALVFFMQAGFAMVETGLPRAPHGFLHRYTDILVYRVWYHVWRDRSSDWRAGSVQHEEHGLYDDDFSDGFLCDFRDDCIRRNGRAYKIFVLLHLQCADQSVCISDFRTLDLGRRMAGAVGIP